MKLRIIPFLACILSFNAFPFDPLRHFEDVFPLIGKETFNEQHSDINWVFNNGNGYDLPFLFDGAPHALLASLNGDTVVKVQEHDQVEQRIHASHISLKSILPEKNFRVILAQTPYVYESDDSQVIRYLGMVYQYAGSVVSLSSREFKWLSDLPSNPVTLVSGMFSVRIIQKQTLSLAAGNDDDADVKIGILSQIFFESTSETGSSRKVPLLVIEDWSDRRPYDQRKYQAVVAQTLKMYKCMNVGRSAATF